MADKMGVPELNENLFNSMPNIWSKQAYLQGFNFENTFLKRYVKMFERKKMAENIYELW